MVSILNNQILEIKEKHLTDFVALSALVYIQNFKLILKRILIPHFFSMMLVYFLFISLYGEFNLTYFLSNEGKIFLTAFFVILVFNLANAIYQSIKIIIFNNLELKDLKLKLIVLFLVLLRLLLLITLIASLYFDNSFFFMLITFIVLNTLFYYFVFKKAEEKFLGKLSRRKLFKVLNLNFKAFLLSVVNRFVIIFIPIFATFSIFIVYEFVRILITGKAFFFVADRLFEFQLWLLFSIVLFLIVNPFQPFTMMIFHKYFYLKEFTFDKKQS
jgi:hypothetical protein